MQDGWTQVARPGFGDHIGPLWRTERGGEAVYGFRVDGRHLNSVSTLHGGMMLAFADQALGLIVWEAIDRRRCATIQLNSCFLGPASAGELVEFRGRIRHRTGTLAFVSGLMEAQGRPVASFDGIWKIEAPGRGQS